MLRSSPIKQAAIDVPLEALHAKITSSGGTHRCALLDDGDLEKTVAAARCPQMGEKAWIQYEFAQPQTIRAFTFVTQEVRTGCVPGRRNRRQPEKRLEASDDGQNFRTVVDIPEGGVAEHTISFAPVTAKYFRVTFKTHASASNSRLGAGSIRHRSECKPPPTDRLRNRRAGAARRRARESLRREGRLRPGAGSLRLRDARSSLPQDAIAKSDVIDLTSKMSADGTLDWTPPAGDWVVLRFGYSLLGITNHPATQEATGLEVDKLDRRYVKNYIETVSRQLQGDRRCRPDGQARHPLRDQRQLGGRRAELDRQHDRAVQQAARLRSAPWLPVLAGRVVESAEASDRFLWDFRKTIADLIADEHYGQLQASLQERGMGHYGESHESGRAFIADGMEVKKLNDSPDERHVDADARRQQRPVRLQRRRSRVGFRGAHLRAEHRGRRIDDRGELRAWAWSPATLKPTADQEFLNGINRFVIHESAHQPLVGKAPGLDAWALRSVVQPQRDLGRTGRRMGRLSRAQLLHAAAGPVRRRRDLLLRRRLEPHSDLRRTSARHAGRLRLRLRQRRRADPRTQRERRPNHDQERHELSGARRSIRTASTCRCPCCAPFTSWCRTGRHRRRTESRRTTPAWPTIRPNSRS